MITPFLWFDGKAEEAAKFYVSTFKNSRLGRISRFDAASAKESGMKEGSVMTVDFEIEGTRFSALNGGPEFKFTPAVSFLIECDTQKEIDRLWDKLNSGGGKPMQCGWLQDKYGVTWQIVPSNLDRLLNDPDAAKARRVMEAMLKMVKLDMAKLENA